MNLATFLTQDFFWGLLGGSIGFAACALMASNTIRDYERAVELDTREFENALLIERRKNRALIDEKIRILRAAALRLTELKPENKESYERQLQEAIAEIEAESGGVAS
jgi:hypothetical protein